VTITTAIVPVEPRDTHTAILLDGVEIGYAEQFVPSIGPPKVHAVIRITPTTTLLVGNITQGFGDTVELAVADAVAAGLRDTEIYAAALREMKSKL
jgi:hypothetical protein